MRSFQVGDIVVGKATSIQYYSITTYETLLEIKEFVNPGKTEFIGKMIATKLPGYVNSTGGEFECLETCHFKFPSDAEYEDIINTCNKLQAKNRLKK
jgi:hypothetical protein